MKIALAQISMCNDLQKNLEKSLEYCVFGRTRDKHILFKSLCYFAIIVMFAFGESKKWQEKVSYLKTRKPQWYK